MGFRYTLGGDRRLIDGPRNRLSAGSATISATIGSITATTPVSVAVDIWIPTGSMTSPREFHTGDTATTLPNGKILVAGGVDNTGYSITSAEIYDPVAATSAKWNRAGSGW